MEQLINIPKTKKKLAIIGSHFGQQEIFDKAKEMGIETHCFAWDKGQHSLCKNFVDYYYPISALDKERILEVCREIKIDGVIARLPAFLPTACYIAQAMNLPGNKYEDALFMINKHNQRQAFLKHGVSSPRFVLVSENIDLSGFDYPLIVKPADRCSSTGVKLVENREDLNKAVNQALEFSFSKEVLIEQYIEGKDVSVNPISWNGKHYRMAVRDKKTTGAPFFVEIEYHEPSELSDDIQAKVIAEAGKALAALNFNYGPSNIDIKVTEDGEVYIIEINPRTAGAVTHELVRLATGWDMHKAWIDLALNQFEEPVITQNKYAGIYSLGKNTEWVKQVIENKDNDPDIITAKIWDDELHYLECSNDKSGYFIYQSEQKRKWGLIKQ